MRRLVVYTCIAGGYDELVAPSAVPSNVDFVCFSETAPNCSIWQMRPLHHKEATPTLTARWHKLNPDVLFPDYDYSLWVDGNVTPSTFALFDRLSELMGSGCLWAGIKHPSRDCIYDEAYRILANGREDLDKLVRTCKFLRKEGFPRHYGLMETNVILRAHNDSKVVATDRLWWKMVSGYTKRDQMSHSYCMWKNGMDFNYILPEGFSARNHPGFKYVVHDKPYVKDRSLKGMTKDGMMVLRKIAFKTLTR